MVNMCNRVFVCWYLSKIPGQRDWVFGIAPEDDPILCQNVLGQFLLAVHVDHISCKSDHGLSTQRSYSSVSVISSYKEQDIRVFNLKACACEKHPNTSVFTHLGTRDWRAVWSRTGCAHLESGRTGRWERQERRRQKDKQCLRADCSPPHSSTCRRSHYWDQTRPWCHTAPPAEGLSNHQN